MTVRAGYEQAPGEGFDVYQGRSGVGISQDRILEELGVDGFENFLEKIGKNIFDTNDPNNGIGTIGSFMNFGFGMSMVNGVLDMFNGAGAGGNFLTQGNSPGFGGDFLNSFSNGFLGIVRSFATDGAEITQPGAGPSTPGFNPDEAIAMNTTNDPNLNPSLSPGGPSGGMVG